MANTTLMQSAILSQHWIFTLSSGPASPPD